MLVKILPNKYVSSGVEGVTLGPSNIIFQVSFYPVRSPDGGTVMVKMMHTKTLVGKWIFAAVEKPETAGALVINRLSDTPAESSVRATASIKPPKTKATPEAEEHPISEATGNEKTYSFVQVFGFEDHRVFNQLLGGAIGAKLTAESRKLVMTSINEAHKKYLEAHAALTYKTSDAVVLQNDPALVVDPVREEAIASAMERDPTLVVISHADLTKARELVEHRWNILCSRINAYGLLVFTLPLSDALDYAKSENEIVNMLFSSDGDLKLPIFAFPVWLKLALESSLSTIPSL